MPSYSQRLTTALDERGLYLCQVFACGDNRDGVVMAATDNFDGTGITEYFVMDFCPITDCLIGGMRTQSRDRAEREFERRRAEALSQMCAEA